MQNTVKSQQKTRLRVAYVSEIPTPYRRPFLQMLAQNSALELTVYYLSASQKDREWKLEEKMAEYEKVLPGIHWCADNKKGYYNHLNLRLLSLLNPRNYDVVIFGAYYVLTMFVGMCWCRLRGVPYVLLCESHGRRKRRGWRVMLKSMFLTPLVKNASAWLPLGSLARQYLVSYGADYDRCFFCPNTPDVAGLQLRQKKIPGENILRKQFDLPLSVPIFLYVGRFIDIKRLDLLLAAYKSVSESGKPSALVLVGSGNNEVTLRRIVAENKIRGVCFLGFQQPDKLLEIYSFADCFVIPSDDEPWAVVVNEAMACGLPVIASDKVGAAPDMIVEGETGFVFPAGDVDALTRCMGKVISNPDFHDEMRDRCQQKALQMGYEFCQQNVLKAVRAASGVK